MIPTTVLRMARTGFGLSGGHVRLLSMSFGKVCLVHRARDGKRTQVRLVPALDDMPARLHAEMAWLSHLATRHQLSVPMPLPWHAGTPVSPPLVAAGSPWLAVACSWVPGRHLNRGVRGADMRHAGALLASMHLAAGDAPPGIASARPAWGVPRLFELATSLRDLIAESGALPAGLSPIAARGLRRSHALLADAWRVLPTGAEHAGLIHTDAHYNNIRWLRTSAGLVDFEDMASGRFMIDVACLWSEFEGRRDARQLLDALLEGYSSVRPLPSAAIHDLHVMLAFRRFDLAGWVLSWPHPAHKDWGPAFLDGTPAYMDGWLAR